jgi:hypothetical protein
MGSFRIMAAWEWEGNILNVLMYAFSPRCLNSIFWSRRMRCFIVVVNMIYFWLKVAV